PRFIPAQVVAELAQLCKAYNVSEVMGDKYAIGFHEDEWRQHGIKFVACERSTSENYLGLLPLLLARRVRLIDSSTLHNQLASLERRVGASDRESVSHPQHSHAHDDVAAAVAGALVAITASPAYRYLQTLPYLAGSPGDEPPDPALAERERRAEEEAQRWLANYKRLARERWERE